MRFASAASPASAFSGVITSSLIGLANTREDCALARLRGPRGEDRGGGVSQPSKTLGCCSCAAGGAQLLRCRLTVVSAQQSIEDSPGLRQKLHLLRQYGATASVTRLAKLLRLLLLLPLLLLGRGCSRGCQLRLRLLPLYALCPLFERLVERVEADGNAQPAGFARRCFQ